MTTAPADTLSQYQTRAAARHLLFDLPFPVMGTVLVLGLTAWLLLGRVPLPAIVAWLAFAALTVVLRETFVRRMQARVERGEGHAQALRGLALLSLPLGAVSGAFAWMYLDPQQPLSQIILGTYMTVVIVGAVVPTSTHLPCFYLLLLPSHGPYLLALALGGGEHHWVIVGIDLLFLGVVIQYAHGAHRMQRDAIRLRWENQRLIEDLARRRAEAEAASRTKSLFLAGVSHDLKQPLRAIALYTGALRHASAAPAMSPAQVSDTAVRIETAVAAVHGQLTRLLELSRLESGAAPVHWEVVDLEELFADLRGLLAGQARERGVQWRFAVGAQRHVLADRAMLASILQNLVGNAIVHGGGRRVHVGTRRCDGLCIEVRDDGRGIDAARQPLLFEAYRSFDDRDAGDGHGLGLAIAKAQAIHLGAGLSLRSAPGCGSTFRLTGLRVPDKAQPTRP